MGSLDADFCAREGGGKEGGGGRMGLGYQEGMHEYWIIILVGCLHSLAEAVQ